MPAAVPIKGLVFCFLIYCNLESRFTLFCFYFLKMACSYGTIPNGSDQFFRYWSYLLHGQTQLHYNKQYLKVFLLSSVLGSFTKWTVSGSRFSIAQIIYVHLCTTIPKFQFVNKLSLSYDDLHPSTLLNRRYSLFRRIWSIVMDRLHPDAA